MGAGDQPERESERGDFDAVIRQFAARVERLERELKELRAKLEARRRTARAAGSGSS